MNRDGYSAVLAAFERSLDAVVDSRATDPQGSEVRALKIMERIADIKNKQQSAELALQLEVLVERDEEAVCPYTYNKEAAGYTDMVAAGTCANYERFRRLFLSPVAPTPQNE